MGRNWVLLVYPFLLFSLTFSGRSRDMTEILLTGTLNLNSINILHLILHVAQSWAFILNLRT